jgi:Neuraminidase (sialidase)
MIQTLQRISAVACCAVALTPMPSWTRAAEVPAPAASASHKSHAKTTAGVVGLDIYAEGTSRLHLLTAERLAAGQKPRLAYTRSEDGGATWTKPVPVGEGQPTADPVKRGNDAQIVAAGNHLVAAWTTGADNKMGRGPLATSISTDGGKTWTPGPSPSDAAGIVDHAFTDLAADDQGNLHAVWLDNRPTFPPTEMPAKALRYARSTDGGRSWSKNLTLDAACCECCWNSLLTLPGGKVCVLYRDKDPRDMALIQSADAGVTWGKPVPVGAFNWGFTGCPHVGGAITATGEGGRDLAALVWTAKGGDEVGVFALASNDAGKSWASPTQLGGPQSSRPDVASSRDGKRLVATWDAFVESGSDMGNAAFASTSDDGGKTWSPSIQLSDSATSATYPRAVRSGDGFRIFWTEQVGGGKPVRWVSRVVR